MARGGDGLDARSERNLLSLGIKWRHRAAGDRCALRLPHRHLLLLPVLHAKVKASILLALNLSPLGAGLENDVEFINPGVRGLMLSRRTGDEKLSCGCGST